VHQLARCRLLALLDRFGTAQVCPRSGCERTYRGHRENDVRDPLQTFSAVQESTVSWPDRNGISIRSLGVPLADRQPVGRIAEKHDISELVEGWLGPTHITKRR
jgi:hypothetical protein